MLMVVRNNSAFQLRLPLPAPPMTRLTLTGAVAPPRGVRLRATPSPAPGHALRAQLRPSSALSSGTTPQPPSTGGAPSTSAPEPLASWDEVAHAARRRGLHLSVKDLGPFYRVTCRERAEDGPVVGMTNGFVAPWFNGLMHCDTLQVFTKGRKGKHGLQAHSVGPLSIGLLLGGATFTYGRSRGCTKAEILAINDDDAWHDRLVKYYGFFGFKPVYRVGGNGLSDVPHMLVWGGEGTRMDADIEGMLRKWTPALRRAALQSAADTGGPGTPPEAELPAQLL